MAIFGKKRSDKDRTAKQGSSEAPGAIVTDPNQIHANAPTLGLRLPSHTPQQQQQQQQLLLLQQQQQVNKYSRAVPRNEGWSNYDTFSSGVL